ncbi:MAG TPA: PQQ-binding-like beta-propeller repeat protein, partial [Nitrososphaerales archaeon]
IDVSTGKTKWQYFMPNPFQGAALAVSGGVVYAVDRVGIFYALDADNGKLLATMNLGGLGAAGVSIGADKKGNMMLLVTSGGSGTDKVTPGTVLALGLGEAPKEVIKEVIKEVPKEVIKEVVKEVTVETVGPISYAAIGIGIVIAVVGLVLSRRRKA